MLRMPQLASHCHDMWLKQPQPPIQLRLLGGERFVMGYFPRMPEDGNTLLMYA